MATSTPNPPKGEPEEAPEESVPASQPSKIEPTPDGYTQRIDLVSKPKRDAAPEPPPPATAEPRPTREPSESGAWTAAQPVVPARPIGEAESELEGVVSQETKPMPAAVWPPPPVTNVFGGEVGPNRPPSLRRRGREATGPNAERAGVLTQELRRALPNWALPWLTSQPVAVWIGARVGLTLLALLAVMMLPGIEPRGTAGWYNSPGGPPLNAVVNAFAGVWTRWDGQWYLKIASEGYNATDGTAAFYPLYPWSVTVFGWLAGERFIWAGILLSSLFFLAALILLHRLVRHDFHSDDAGRTVFYIAAFPMAFFFFAVYSESLFLLLSVAALLAMRSQRWWWAALATALAIWTRSTGLLLFLPLGWELWRAYHPPRPSTPTAMPPARPSRWALPSLALPVASLLGFVAWSWIVFREPFAPLGAQSGWNRHFSWPWQTLTGAWNAATQVDLRFQPENQSWTYLVAFVFVVIMGLLALRWLRTSYSIYLWAGIIFPLFSATPYNPLLSYSRFVAVLFPAFIVLALVGRNRYANQLITWASLLLLALYTIRFANWYWVA